MLWIAIHLPLLSLESWAATLPFTLSAPLALMDVKRVLHVNAQAQALGVQPGLKRATALALAPDLLLGQPDEKRDAQALLCVAHAASVFTPTVHLASHPAHTVLLEVQASLRCFGGEAMLLQGLQAALALLPHRMHLALAPTPQGAALLARWAACASKHNHATPFRCGNLTDLQHQLHDAPLTLLASAAGHEDTLHSMGLHTLGALCRLPRAGLNRRFGEALLDEIDRLLGNRADPRLPLVLPETFHAQLELWTRADTTDQLLPAATVLLEQLLAWARARQGRVACFSLRLKHEQRRTRGDADNTPANTHLRIALTQASAELAHLQALLREHLARLQLPAPTLEIHLECADWVQNAPPNESLFPTPQSESEGLVQLIERLQARLGPEHVRRLAAVADHRPECASHSFPAQAGIPHAQAQRNQQVQQTAPAAARPVWLRSPPQALKERSHRPCLNGQTLQLLCGPERIESGWWDGLLCERDYFIARQPSGALVWVYRLRHAREGDEVGWFLQGWFG